MHMDKNRVHLIDISRFLSTFSSLDNGDVFKEGPTDVSLYGVPVTSGPTVVNLISLPPDASV